MQKDAIIDWAFARMGEADDTPLEPGYRWRHGCRVASLAIGLAKSMNLDVNTDNLYVAGVLHDVGKSGGQPGSGHGPRGADIIRAEIPHLFSDEELVAICDIVANHYMRPNSARFEGKEAPKFPDEVLLIQDADILDHYGCTGIYIGMYWSAHLKSAPEDILQHFRKEEADVDRLSQPLNFAASKAEFAVRWQTIKHFYDLLAREEAGELLHIS